MQPEAVLGKALYDAALNGDAHAVAAWLDEGGEVDAGCAERDGATLLLTAATAHGTAATRAGGIARI